MRQLLTESLLLAFGGAAIGTLLALVLGRVLVSFFGDRTFVDLQIDWRVLGFATGLAILTACIFGLAPAWRATRASPARIMSAAGRGLTTSRERFGVRKTLVVIQVALSLMLVASALLFAVSFRKVLAIDAGFQRDGLVAMDVDPSPLHLTNEQLIVLQGQLLQRIRAIPGMSSAANAFVIPIIGGVWNDEVIVNGKKISDTYVEENSVSDGFFRTMGTPLLMGRDFDSRDTSTSTPVAIVNEEFAHKMLGTDNPLGRTFKVSVYQGRPQFEYQVVGMVKNTKYADLREEFRPIAYYAAQQAADQRGFSVVTRSALTTGDAIQAIREAAGSISPAIQVDFEVYSTEIKKGLLRERLLASLSGFFGVLDSMA
jgi:putative ABC transport system permease protein